MLKGLSKNQKEYLQIYDIDTLPVAKYYEIKKSGDLSLLCNKKVKYDTLYLAWAKINDEITQIIGQNDEYIKYLQLKISYLENIKKFHSGDKFAYNIAMLDKIDAEQIAKEIYTGKDDYTEICLQLSKSQGYHINTNKISTREYFTLIKINLKYGDRGKK